MTRGVVTFGEMLLHLTSPDHERFLQSARFEAVFGGAEANVAVALAGWNVPAAYVTVLPENHPFTDAGIAELRRFGVDTAGVGYGSGRFGLYYMESGVGLWPSRIVYDREHSAMAGAKPGDIDWQRSFGDSDWFHTSGITPAISRSAAELTAESMRAAREGGLRVSFDLNYRKSLWNWGRSAPEVLRELTGLADVLIGNYEHLKMVLGMDGAADSDVTEQDRYERLTEIAMGAFPNLKTVVLTVRSPTHWSACLAEEGSYVESRKYDISQVVDRIGSGDAFAAGLIFGIKMFASSGEALEFGAAAGCLKHFVQGDFLRASVDDVNAIVTGGDAGGVKR
jgi:2-dehydro-3-deoxygluconokinase